MYVRSFRCVAQLTQLQLQSGHCAQGRTSQNLRIQGYTGFIGGRILLPVFSRANALRAGFRISLASAPLLEGRRGLGV